MSYNNQYIVLHREAFDELMNIIESHGYKSSVDHDPLKDKFSFSITENSEEGELVLQRSMIVLTKGVC